MSSSVVALSLVGGCTADWDAAPWSRELPSIDAVSVLRSAPDCNALTEAATPVLTAAVDAMWPEADRGWFSGGDDSAGNEDSASSEGSADGSDTATAERSTTGFSQAPATTNAPAAPSADASESEATVDGAISGDAGDRVVIGTNNQEQRVDESDLVKTDGEKIVAITDGTLHVVQLDGTPAIDGVLDLTVRGASQLFLRGDTALVMGTTYGDSTGYGNGGFGNSGSGIDTPLARDLEQERDTGTGMGTPPMTMPPGPPPTTEPADGSTTTTVRTTTVPITTTPTTTPPTSTTAPPTTSSTTSSSTTTAPPTTTTALLAPPPFAVATTLTLVDLSDVTAPAVLSTADVEGSMVTAREIDGRARVVVQSTPMGVQDLSLATSRDQAEAAVRSLDGRELLPRVAIDGSTQNLGGCDDVLLASSAPPSVTNPDGMWAGDPAASMSTVTVVTVGDSLDDLQPVSVQGAADTVYASTDSLFVASGSWDQAGSRTDVHRFDLGGDGPANYTGSGRAPGRLLNQFSLSERDGALRIVTTLDGSGLPVPVEPDIGGTSDDNEVTADIARLDGPSSARLTVLDTDGALDEIGHLDGMGIGEEVQSVRFLDDLAYVVTFRQVDPLYAIDLSDPRVPTLLGELKIPGFSEYLHPVGDGMLLGVGREVDPATGIDLGLKISLFDVSDPVQMAEVDQIIVANAWSAISSDHKAFTWDPTRRRAIIPVERDCATAEVFPEEPVAGVAASRVACMPSGAAKVIGVDGATLSEVAEIGHQPEWSAGATIAPIRSSIVDDDLWTLSPAGLGRSDANDPAGVALLEF